jgi:methyl-accepting chemotaxis protein
MDQELIAYLDGRFTGLREQLQGQIGELRGEMGQLRSELRGEMAELRGQMGELQDEMRTAAADTRRHFDVVAEDLTSRIQLVAEGVALSNERLERFRGEVTEQFRVVDGRLLRLEARASTA